MEVILDHPPRHFGISVKAYIGYDRERSSGSDTAEASSHSRPDTLQLQHTRQAKLRPFYHLSISYKKSLAVTTSFLRLKSLSMSLAKERAHQLLNKSSSKEADRQSIHMSRSQTTLEASRAVVPNTRRAPTASL